MPHYPEMQSLYLIKTVGGLCQKIRLQNFYCKVENSELSEGEISQSVQQRESDRVPLRKREDGWDGNTASLDDKEDDCESFKALQAWEEEFLMSLNLSKFINFS